ncbi:MAG: NAD(P)/FAD-dependent oxidoreductase [Chloroflexi bacterium]|nr:NAD(P)/FAD-dependent oxidoreductase [Chloroflexota bacterium]
MRKVRIVILGAGFGGLTACLELVDRLKSRWGVEVVLVDRHPYHLFTPLLFQVVTGGVDPGHIAHPIRWLLRDRRFQFYESEIKAIDLACKKVVLPTMELTYDILVIGLGSTTNFFGVPKAENYSFPVKTVREAVAIKNRIIDAFRQAELEPNDEARRRILSFAVVGGGATGVELVASLYDLVHMVLAKDYPRARPEDTRVCLIEATNSLLGGMDPKMGEIAMQSLQNRGVRLHLGCRIVGMDNEGVHTADGQHLQYRLVIWASGIRPSPLVEPLALEKARDGRIIVGPYLDVPQWPGVYAVGDLAAYTEPGAARPLPAKAAVAEQQGRSVARNIVHILADEDPETFRYKYQGDLVALGRDAAVAKLFGRSFNGFVAWIFWRAIHLQKVPGFRNRMSVAQDWSFDYVLRRDTMHLE